MKWNVCVWLLFNWIFEFFRFVVVSAKKWSYISVKIRRLSDPNPFRFSVSFAERTVFSIDPRRKNRTIFVTLGKKSPHLFLPNDFFQWFTLSTFRQTSKNFFPLCDKNNRWIKFLGWGEEEASANFFVEENFSLKEFAKRERERERMPIWCEYFVQSLQASSDETNKQTNKNKESFIFISDVIIGVVVVHVIISLKKFVAKGWLCIFYRLNDIWCKNVEKI